ncbi:MAG: hypothetical protein JNJ45_09420 [Chthonomonas sp.]|nr:hypothetical protein [Chthonomonas sp.]
MSKIALLVLPAAVALSGCAKSGDSYKGTAKADDVKALNIAKGQEKTLFPVKEGNSWVFDTQTTSTFGAQQAVNDTVFTFTIGKVFPIEGGVEFEMLIGSDQEVNGEKSSEKQMWRLTDKGVSVAAARVRPNLKVDKLEMVPFNPPQPFMFFPLEEGKVIDWSGVGPLPAGGGSDTNPVGPSKFSLTCAGTQKTDTAEKSYMAYVFEQEQTWTIPGFDKAKYQAELAKQQGVAPNSGGTSPIPKDKEEAKLMAELEPKVGQGISAVTSHWAPNVGLVRLRQEIAINNLIIIQIFKLKKANLK